LDPQDLDPIDHTSFICTLDPQDSYTTDFELTGFGPHRTLRPLFV